MKKKTLILTVCLGLLFVASEAFAQPVTQTLTVNATVNAKAKLTLSGGTINFPDADPDVVNKIPANVAINIDAKVRTTTGGASTLTHLAPNPLKNAALDEIAINNVEWTATGPGFVTSGTLGPSVTAGNWTGSGDRSGTFNYLLQNSWDYATGAYTVITTYSLSVP